MQKHMESGEVRPVIDRTYPLAETPESLRYIHEGHTQARLAKFCRACRPDYAAARDYDVICLSRHGQMPSTNGSLASSTSVASEVT